MRRAPARVRRTPTLRSVQRTNTSPLGAALSDVTSYLGRLREVLARMPQEPLAEMTELLLAAGQEDRAIYILGNGGSAATASHFACDLAKTANMRGHPRLRALAFTDNVPLLTAWGNDAAYEEVFAEQVRTFTRPGDLIIAISASGNSPNVLAAVHAARELGARVIGLTGFGGGKLHVLCDVCLVVPSDEYGPVEDAHMIVVHAITAAIRAARATRLAVVLAAGETAEAAIH